MNEPCFFYSVDCGDYFLSSARDFSAYQGWFVFFEKEWNLFKVVDSITGFDVSVSNKSLFLSKSGSGESYLDLDFRWVHDFSDEGRIYDVYEKNGVIIIKYSKFSDNSLSVCCFSKFLAIRGLSDFSFLKQWVKKFYYFDAQRGAINELYVFRLLKTLDKELIFGFGDNEEEAIINSLVKPVERQENFFLVHNQDSAQKKLFDEERDALLAVNSAFNSCIKKNYSGEELIFAGYPWFFQVWARDECISLVGLFVQKRFDLAKRIIMRNLKSLQDGLLPNRYPDSVLKSADATGWLFQRIFLLFNLSKDVFSEKDRLFIEKKLDSFLSYCKVNSYKGLVLNGPKETWMDTVDFSFKDTREGARVEIQALFLCALELKRHLRKLAGDVEGASRVLHKLRKKKTLIRKQLIKNGIIHDGVVNNVLDLSVRPNVFLAYYAYPGLAMSHQWGATFDHVLRNCWLDWGGLSSIGKNHELFRDTYSGMNNQSYHRGDSWFFINNISALVLYDFDSKKYKNYIKKIKRASVGELLYSGCLGYCAELSSAKKLESNGCLVQSWSSSTLLELLSRIKKV